MKSMYKILMASNSNARFDVMVIGSCNTDLFAYTKEMPKVGQTVHGYKFSIGCGGKGANQCIAAAKLGASTAMLAKLGNDQFGAEFKKNFANLGVNTECIEMIEGSTGVAQITVCDNGDNHIVIVAGANDSLNELDLKNSEDFLKSSKVILFQFETPLQTTIHALKMCKKFENDVLTIVNGAPALPHLDEEFLSLCDVFCVNEIEAEITAETSVRNVDEAKTAACKLRAMGCCIPIITLGAEGVVFIPKEEQIPIHIEAKRVKAVDTTGAGDAFLGALAYFIAKFPDLSLEEDIRRACEVAAYSVQRPGTSVSFPTREDLPETLLG